MKYLDEVFDTGDFDHMCAFLRCAKKGAWPEEFLDNLPADVHIDGTTFDKVANKIAVAGVELAVTDLEETLGWTNPFE